MSLSDTPARCRKLCQKFVEGCGRNSLKLTHKNARRKEAVLWINEPHVSPLSHTKSQASIQIQYPQGTTLKLFPVFFSEIHGKLSEVVIM